MSLCSLLNKNLYNIMILSQKLHLSGIFIYLLDIPSGSVLRLIEIENILPVLLHIFNRPGVAGAVLQSPLLLID